MKKYRYNFVDLGVEIFADSGREVELKFFEIYGDTPSGTIELTNMETGESRMMYPIKIK